MVESREMLKVALSAHPRPARILSIGLGDGGMVRAAISDDRVHDVTVIELNGVLRTILAQSETTRSIFSSSKLKYIVDDGRRWLIANPDKRFDVIMMWPLHAAHAYYNNLYSSEFLELTKNHLAEGGILYLQTVDAYSSASTLAHAFSAVVRLGDSSYVASDSPLRFAHNLTGVSLQKLKHLIQADRLTILRNNQNTKLNTDRRPQSEYYLTYAHRDALSPNRAPHYHMRDTRRRANLIDYPSTRQEDARP